MSNSNIFYHEDNLSDTICDVSQGLKLVRAVVFEPTSDESTLSFGEREGLLLLIDSLYQALSLALGEAMSVGPSNTEDATIGQPGKLPTDMVEPK